MQFRNVVQTGVRNAGLAAALFSTVLNPVIPLSLGPLTGRSRDNDLIDSMGAPPFPVFGKVGIS